MDRAARPEEVIRQLSPAGRRPRISPLLGALLVAGIVGAAVPRAVVAQASAPPPPVGRVPLPELPPLDLVDVPTAGMLERGTYEVEMSNFHEGGLIVRLRLGISNALQIGAAYGGVGVIGATRPDWYPRPELHLKVRLMDEDTGRPALAVGFDSQGIGSYTAGDFDRYEVKAKGIFLVASKSFRLMDGFGLHAGLGYNPLEGKARRTTPDIYAGADVSLRPGFGLVVEYDVALNDDDQEYFRIERDRGFLNAGASVELADGLELMIHLRDILERTRTARQSRELRVAYRKSF
jgi:hypothetical protein